MSKILEVRALITRRTCAAVFDYVIIDYLWNIESKLDAAVTCGNLEAVKYLYSIGKLELLDLNECAYLAIMYNHVDILKYVVSVGADFYGHDINSVFETAVDHGHVEILKYLISIGADVHTNTDHVVRLAAMRGHLEFMKYLVSVGVKVCGGEHELALNAAAHEGHLNIVMYLVSIGAIVTRRSIQLANMNRDTIMVDYLKSFDE